MKRSNRPRQSAASDESSTQQRLQKVLAAAGIGSRRDCETYILEGRVEVNRQTVTELGTKVNPQEDDIRVDGTALHKPKKHYYALNKPPGVVSTNFDPGQRTRVIDLVPVEERLFPVGRLDRGSEGLILVTNDGELANRLTHPRYGVEKTYFVRVAGTPSDDELHKLRRGVHLAEGVARVVSIKVRKRYRQHTDLEIVLNEGKNREIRRILARVGHKVMQLRRLAVGPLRLGELPVGACRKLTSQEVAALLEATRQQRKKGDATPAEKYRGKPPAQRFAGSDVVVEDGPMAKGPADNRRPAAAKLRPAISADRPSGPRERPARPGRNEEHSIRPAMAEVPSRRTTSTGSASPPKIDLSVLLNPRAAPKVAIAVNDPSPAAAQPSIGDVLDYNAGDDTSVRGFETPPPPKSRRDAAAKIAAETEPSFDLPSPKKAAIARSPQQATRHVPRGLKADARRIADRQPARGRPTKASGSPTKDSVRGGKPGGRPAKGKGPGKGKRR